MILGPFEMHMDIAKLEPASLICGEALGLLPNAPRSGVNVARRRFPREQLVAAFTAISRGVTTMSPPGRRTRGRERRSSGALSRQDDRPSAWWNVPGLNAIGRVAAAGVSHLRPGPEDDGALCDDLERRGYTVDSATRAMGMALNDIGYAAVTSGPVMER